MSSEPTVHFRCVTCKWRHDVPAERIAIVGGIPRSVYIPFHQCEGGADVEEVASHEAEVHTTTPVQWAKITL